MHLFLRLLFELVFAFSAGYGDLAHLAGQAQQRAALRAFEVFVLLHVLQAIHHLLCVRAEIRPEIHKFLIFRPTLFQIAGKHAEDRQNEYDQPK